MVACLPEVPVNEGDSAVSTAIVNGTDAEPGAYPWMVFEEVCGGTLIAEEWVLTAAHCTHALAVGETIHIGGTEILAMRDGVDGDQHVIAEIIDHPEWDPSTLMNDFSLLRLSEPSFVTPLPIDLGDAHAGTDGMAIGWGLLSEGGDRPNALQEVILPVIEQDVCVDAFMDVDRSWVQDEMICAGYFEGGTSVCNGDSGGPLVSTVTGELIGVASFSVGCAREGFPAVFARVSSAQDWICETTDNTVENCVSSQADQNQQPEPQPQPEIEVTCDVTNDSYIGDGYCDGAQDGYNTEACGYDGGDCCETTCVDGEYGCGTNEFECLDPNAD